MDAEVVVRCSAQGIEERDKEHILQIAASRNTLYFLFENGKVSCTTHYNGIIGTHHQLVNIFAQSICAGPDYFMAITKNGKCCAMGDNFGGKLGVGHLEPVNHLTDVQLKAAVRSVTCTPFRAFFFTCKFYCSTYIVDDNRVFASGSNSFNSMGISTKQSYVSTPTELKHFKNTTMIASGSGHTIALHGDKLLGCGQNSDGQLIGLLHDAKVEQAMYLPFPYIACYVACGLHDTCVVTKAGAVFCSGDTALAATSFGRNKVFVPYRIKAVYCGSGYAALVTIMDQVCTVGISPYKAAPHQIIKPDFAFAQVLACDNSIIMLTCLFLIVLTRFSKRFTAETKCQVESSLLCLLLGQVAYQCTIRVPLNHTLFIWKSF